MALDVQYLNELISSSDHVRLAKEIKEHNLVIKDGKLFANQDTIKETTAFWDKRQLVRKILLNSAYGAILNNHCRYFDQRIGQSVTLSGRTIVKHQCSQANYLLTDVYQYDGDAVIYADTDSTYFTMWNVLKSRIESGELEWSKELEIQLADTIGEQVNESFPRFLEGAFHCPRKNGEIIQTSRELVADRGLFIVKKRYALNVYDKEGKRLDVEGSIGEIKAMGLDLKRSDTPKYVQEFLMEILKMVLEGKERDDIIPEIKKFKETLRKQAPWTKGSPRSVNKLTQYGQKEESSKKGRVTMPGHVRGSLNWNYLRKLNGDNYSMQITDGMRIIVCQLKNNPLGFSSIAYPTDELRLPSWFTELPFDENLMEKTLVDTKIDNLLGVLKWDLTADTDIKSTFNDLFSFD